MECKHENLEWDAPEPSVGIFGYLLWCADCGAEALDFEEVHDEDPYSGLVVGFDVKKWRPQESRAEVIAGISQALGKIIEMREKQESE